MPNAYDLERFLGAEYTPSEQVRADDHVQLVTTFVKAYTRGRGFDATGEPNAELAAVIVTAAARLLMNPTGNRRESAGDYDVAPFVDGWTLPELAVLHRHRRRTA